jgi:putative nucleotidyltransferase with HDIG domain
MGELFSKIMLDDIDIPGMPGIAAKVLAVLEDERASMRQLEAVIFEDQSLTSTILKIANAPIYKTGKSINTLAEALMVIGLQNLIALVSIVSLTNHLAAKHADKDLQKHFMAVSSASAMLAAHTKRIKKEEAMVAGLLHDIGKTVLSANANSHYKTIKERAKKEDRPFAEIEDEVLGFNHTHIGSALARKWKLPKVYEYVIKHHHDISVKRNADINSIEYETALCYLVRTADKIALDAGIGIGSAHEKNIDHLLDALKIDEEAYEETAKNIAKSLEAGKI